MGHRCQVVWATSAGHTQASKIQVSGGGPGHKCFKTFPVTQAQPGLSTSQDLHWQADLCTNGGECDHRCLSLSRQRANCVGRQRDLSYFINVPFEMPSPPVLFSLAESCHRGPHLVPELSSCVCSQRVQGRPGCPILQAGTLTGREQSRPPGPPTGTRESELEPGCPVAPACPPLPGLWPSLVSG